MDDISVNDINKKNLFDLSIRSPNYTLYLESMGKGLRYSLFDHSKGDYILRTYSKSKIRMIVNLIGIKFSKYRLIKYAGARIMVMESFYE